MQRILWLCVVLSGNVLVGTHAFGEDTDLKWGHLKGQVLLKGKLTALPLAVVGGGGLAFGDIPDESLVVDDQTKGIANVMLYLRKKPAAVHPDLMISEQRTVKFEAEKGVFKPHAMFVRTDQKIAVANVDTRESYAVDFHPIRNNGGNFLVAPQRDPVVLSLGTPERIPVPVRCHIHPWMMAYWLVLDHPYAAVTGKDGSFEIKHLPVGDHEFHVWQERIGYVNRVR